MNAATAMMGLHTVPISPAADASTSSHVPTSSPSGAEGQTKASAKEEVRNLETSQSRREANKLQDDSEANIDLSAIPNDAAHDNEYLNALFSGNSTLLSTNPLFGQLNNGEATFERHVDFMRYAKTRTIEELAQEHLDNTPDEASDLQAVRRRMSNRIDNAKQKILAARGNRITRGQLNKAFDAAKAVYGVDKRKNLKAGKRRKDRKVAKNGQGGKADPIEIPDSEDDEIEERNVGDEEAAEAGEVAVADQTEAEEYITEEDITSDDVFGAHGAALALLQFSTDTERGADSFWTN